MDLVGKTVGNYVVRGKLGSGGMGAVYLCEHPLLGRKVALKVLHEAQSRDPTSVQRFFTEARAANDIGNEHIVDIIDFGRIADGPDEWNQYYLEMEYLGGPSLADRLATLDVDESVHVARQCCDALGASHAKGIIHRDLKPDNIFLVEKTGDALFVKIVDFGIAKLMSGQGARTQIGTILGTPAYMSPEQCEGLGRIDHRTDIYSLGVVLYQMVTKRLPFPGPDLRDIIVGHLREPPPHPSTINSRVTAAMAGVILHALAKQPDERFQSMADLDRALADPETHFLAWSSGGYGVQPTVRADTPVLAPDACDSVLQAPTTEKPPVLPMLRIPVAESALVEAPVHRGRRATLAVAIGAAGAAALAIAIALLTSQSPSSAPPAPQPAAWPSPTNVQVSRRIVSRPPGARVFRVDGTLDTDLGQAPIVISADRGAPPVKLRLVLEGHVTQVRTIATDRSDELLVSMPPQHQDPVPEL